MKKIITTILFTIIFAVSAFAAPVASAGTDMTVAVGEAVRLDGSASTGYISESQTNGTWSIQWQTGDGYQVENMLKCPHVYTAAGVYTATLTVKDVSGATSVASIRVTAQNIPAATGSNVQTLTDTGNPATNKTNLQAAVDRAAANPGTNEILVPAGFVFNDALRLPARTSSNYVTIRVADLSGLPENRRVTANDKAKLFRMNMRGAGSSGYNNALEMRYGAKYYRIIGMEIRKSVSEVNTDMIGPEYVNEVANNNHIIIDRSLLDGNGFEVRKGLVMNAESMSVLNTSILNIKALGYESKAIANWSGGGPLAAVNCRLEAASINILIGGASPKSEGKLVDGFLLRGNYVWKNPAWANAGYAVKNLFEMKHGRNVVAVGNVFENNYADAQQGWSVVLSSLTDEGCSYCVTENIDFRNNKILNSRGGFNVSNMQAYAQPFPPYANHIRFFNNYWEMTSGLGSLTMGAKYFEVIHNTFNALNSVPDSPVSFFTHFESGSGQTPESYKAPGYKLLNNFHHDTSAGMHLRCAHHNGGGALADHLAADYDVRKNVFPGAIASTHPVSNYYPASGKLEFIDYAGGNFSLKAGSAYKGAATDGKDIGVDWTTLNASTASATSGVWNSSTSSTTDTTTLNGQIISSRTKLSYRIIKLREFNTQDVSNCSQNLSDRIMQLFFIDII